MPIAMFQEDESSPFPLRPSPVEIRRQVDRILQSKAFDASERNRSFLQYVVDETLEGRAVYIKGYTVACTVFRRDADFDPQLDPVVRIEASRLRRSLERYYLTAGKADLVMVELPKGGYVPRFSISPEVALGGPPLAISDVSAGPPSQAGPALPLGSSIEFSPFVNLSGDPTYDSLSLGIADELLTRLISCAGMTVRAAMADEKPLAVGRGVGLVIALEGSIRAASKRLRVTVRLREIESSIYLWAESFDWESDTADSWSLQEQIADKIVGRVAGAYGAAARIFYGKIAYNALPDAEV
jgi:TolB-like protein